jgi:hypothetical protein
MGTVRGQQIAELRNRAHIHVSSQSRSQLRRIAITEGLDMTDATLEMDSMENVIFFPVSTADLPDLDGPSEADLAEIARQQVEDDLEAEEYAASILDGFDEDYEPDFTSPYLDYDDK